MELVMAKMKALRMEYTGYMDNINADEYLLEVNCNEQSILEMSVPMYVYRSYIRLL